MNIYAYVFIYINVQVFIHIYLHIFIRVYVIHINIKMKHTPEIRPFLGLSELCHAIILHQIITIRFRMIIRVVS